MAAVVATSLAWGVLAVRSSEAVSDLPGPDAVAGGPGDVVGGELAAAPPPDARAFPELSSATDADLGDSVWFVLDRRGRRVHRFDQSGALLGSFARQGEGPGELSFPSAVAVHRDTVVVADRRTVHLYAPSGEHIEDRRVSFDHCLGPRIADVDSGADGLLFLVHCANPAQSAAVFLATEDGRARRLAAASPEGRGTNVLSYAFMPVVSARSGGFLFGDASSDCLDLFDGGGAPKRRFCHNRMPRLPLSKKERDDVEDEFRGLAGAVGFRVDVPETLPPFDRVFTLEDERLAYRALVRDSDGEVTMSRLIVQGETGDALALPAPAASAVFAAGESALAAWEALDAVHVAVYSLRDF